MANRTITFGNTELDKQRFRFLFMAVLNGAPNDGAGQPKQRSWEEQRADGKILRALKAVTFSETMNQGLATEYRQRVLKSEGGSLTLTSEQFDKLKSWWKRVQWPMFDIDDVDDAYEWLCGAPEEP